MKLVVGLGNFGKEYENTFHNLGFAAIDRTAEILGFKFSKEKFRAKLAEGKIGGEKVVLAKPLTYMNLSGLAVSDLADFYKIDLKDLLIIYDDFDLKSGYIRVRENGSAGTHNGMRNITEVLGSSDFPRVRIGFKPEGEIVIPLIDFVLSKIPDAEKEIFIKATESAANAAVAFIKGEKISDIIAKYNGDHKQ